MKKSVEDILKQIAEQKQKQPEHRDQRAKEIMQKVDTVTALEDMYSLGYATACGIMLFLIHSKKTSIEDLSEFLLSQGRDRETIREDMLITWMELMNKEELNGHK